MLGYAMEVHWKATPGLAFCMITTGTLLLVIHDLSTRILGLWITAHMFSHMANSR